MIICIRVLSICIWLCPPGRNPPESIEEEGGALEKRYIFYRTTSSRYAIQNTGDAVPDSLFMIVIHAVFYVATADVIWRDICIVYAAALLCFEGRAEVYLKLITSRTNNVIDPVAKNNNYALNSQVYCYYCQQMSWQPVMGSSSQCFCQPARKNIGANRQRGYLIIVHFSLRKLTKLKSTISLTIWRLSTTLVAIPHR